MSSSISTLRDSFMSFPDVHNYFFPARTNEKYARAGENDGRRGSRTAVDPNFFISRGHIVILILLYRAPFPQGPHFDDCSYGFSASRIESAVLF
ncbi:hypothetical protein CEXT_306961 [Caerostris extrusa]|uniref:Uncharacterized protein n=1 Tax=Caerostris extrusa TaxID=172846 RepID=A0AAV4XV36_CAEEX|nr:hypothetical protein CEXT_306961 [Caerostris extrusa]